MYYNMSNITQADNLMVMTQNINIASGYILGFLMLVAVFVILFISFKNFGVRTTMPIIFFLCTIISIFLAIMEIIPDYISYIMIIATAGLILASIFINPEG